jgi:thymidylate synthase ThyX
MKRKIFAVLGVLPEPAGYATAKFSRTPVHKSYQKWTMELTEEGAGRFYNSFYFQYGHASIADLAHAMVVFENISVPARNLLFDDQLLDIQDKSTRYVDFSQAEWVIPPELKENKELLMLFEKTIGDMVALYLKVSHKIADFYYQKYYRQKPKEMGEENCRRITQARAFDVARYLLPCAYPTSAGIIASARTWERIICKFLSSDLKELQQIGKEIQQSICRKPAFNPSLVKIEKIDFLSKSQKGFMKRLVAGKNIALPTLVKFAKRKEYPKNVYRQVKKLLPLLKLKSEPDNKRGIELFENVDPQIELVATLFYRVSPYSYRQILKTIKTQKPDFIKKVINLFYSKRKEHDAVSREAATGNLVFDICIDIGAFRDLHRHRNCIHILKDLSPVYGFDMPEEIEKVGLDGEYQAIMKEAETVFWKIEKKYPGVGQYILPQSTKRRFLVKMTPWELQYITELRTRPQGHFSYREIAFQMYQEFAKKHPLLAKHFRVVNPKITDFFRR